MKKSLLALMATGVMATSMMSAPATAGANPFIGEIMVVGNNFCPRGWATADGQLLAISSNDALFSLLGTLYGGDGRTTFALPDLRGRTPIHLGSGPGLSSFSQGSRGGAETVSLTSNNLPNHTHVGSILAAHTQVADAANPRGNAFARSGATNYANNEAPSTDLADAMHSGTVAVAASGSNLPVNNMQPYQVVNYCVALVGIYPSRS